MPEFPPGFLPDLRALRPWPTVRDSLWREPCLVEQTYEPLYRLVRGHLDPPCEVLDVGCGTGYMALELAREGCRVLGIDPDEESIALARRAQEADPLLRDGTALAYEVADVRDWRAPPGSFDAVVASRVLHHVAELEHVLAKVAKWLRPGGALVCVDFAYDRFDRRSASWLYQVRGLLRAHGSTALGERVDGDVRKGVDRVWEAWWRDHEQEHRLNSFDQLIGAFRGALAEQHKEWLPYLYWEALAELDLPADPGATVARFVRSLEQHLIAEEALPAVLFSWVGVRGPATG